MIRAELKPLTSLRFLAALGVFFYHVPDFTTGQRNHFLQAGHLGVSFFFVLSGFILAYNYTDRLRRITWASLRSFYIARFARVYPVHALTLLLAVPMAAADGQLYDGLKCLVIGVLNAGLLQSFYPKKHVFFSFNSVSWSVSVEAFFYLVFPFLCMIIRPPRNAKLFFPITVALLLAVRTWPSHWAQGRFSEDAVFWISDVFPPSRLAEFILGILLYHLFSRAPMSPSGSGRLLFASMEWLLAGSMAAVLLVPGLAWQLDRSVLTLLMGLIVLVFAYGAGLLSRLLSLPQAVLLGEASYSLYMLHRSVIWAAERSKVFTHTPPAISVSLVLGAVLLVSLACFRWFEIPMRNRIRNAV